jgi:hypothetical protein
MVLQVIDAACPEHLQEGRVGIEDPTIGAGYVRALGDGLEKGLEGIGAIEGDPELLGVRGLVVSITHCPALCLPPRKHGLDLSTERSRFKKSG